MRLICRCILKSRILLPSSVGRKKYWSHLILRYLILVPVTVIFMLGRGRRNMECCPCPSVRPTKFVFAKFSLPQPHVMKLIHSSYYRPPKKKDSKFGCRQFTVLELFPSVTFHASGGIIRVPYTPFLFILKCLKPKPY